MVSKRFVIDSLKYVLAFGLLALVIWMNWGHPDDEKGLAYVWKRHAVEGNPINYGYLLVGMALLGVAALLTFVRWYVLVRAVGLPFRLTDAVRLGMIGFFFNIVLPGGVGGDLVKMLYIAREQDRRATAVATILIDRVLAVWGIFWFVALVGSACWALGLLEVAGERALKTIVIVALAGVAASVVGWTLLGWLSAEGADRFEKRLERGAGRFGARIVGAVCVLFVALGRMSRERVEHVKERLREQIGHSIAQLWNAFWLYRQRPGIVALTLGISFVGFVGFTLTFHCMARVLCDNFRKVPSVFEHFLVVPIGLLIQGVPLFPGGAGIAEAGFGGLYKLLGYAAAFGILGSLVQRVSMWVLSLPGLFLYLRMRPTLKVEEKKEEEALAGASG